VQRASCPTILAAKEKPFELLQEVRSLTESIQQMADGHKQIVSFKYAYPRQCRCSIPVARYVLSPKVITLFDTLDGSDVHNQITSFKPTCPSQRSRQPRKSENAEQNHASKIFRDARCLMPTIVKRRVRSQSEGMCSHRNRSHYLTHTRDGRWA
jgi:hypothetical protein